MSNDDRFVLVLGGAFESDGQSRVPSELSKYFVKGKITDVVTLGNVVD